MNTTARLESTSKPGRIQCSRETGELLKTMGKEIWLQKREEAVRAEGKGELSTYWVNVAGERAGSVVSGSQSASSDNVFKLKPSNEYGRQLPGLDDRTYRLVDWNVETLLRIMKEIIAHRNAKEASSKRKSVVAANFNAKMSSKTCILPLEEVQEIISLPAFDVRAAKKQVNPEKIEIPAEVVNELHRFVSVIASLYRNNPFHNFDHASVSINGLGFMYTTVFSLSFKFAANNLYLAFCLLCLSARRHVCCQINVPHCCPQRVRRDGGGA